jgi:hypothetical protein
MAKRKGQQDNDLQNTTQKTKDRATRTLLIMVGNAGASKVEVVSASLVLY